MHCPNCGTETPIEQRYCRACGLNLEKIAEALAEQLPAMSDAAPPDESKAGWRRHAERVGFGALLCAGAIGVVSICWVLITKIIIAKGEYLSGSVFLFIILALVIGGSLLALSDSSNDTKQKRPAPSTEPTSLPAAEPTGKILPEPQLEPVPPSVTERTTEFLHADKKRSRN